ncbi:MAG: hypothetical protein AAGE43_06200 [Pseudomonadota bacterium]
MFWKAVRFTPSEGFDWRWYVQRRRYGGPRTDWVGIWIVDRDRLKGIVDAVQYTEANRDLVEQLLREQQLDIEIPPVELPLVRVNPVVVLRPGDYLIQNERSELSVCPQDCFPKRYRRASLPSAP